MASTPFTLILRTYLSSLYLVQRLTHHCYLKGQLLGTKKSGSRGRPAMIEVSTKYVKLFLPQLADSPAGTSVMLVSCSRSIKYAKLCLAVVFTTNRSVIKVLGVVAGNGPRQWCYVAILRFKRRKHRPFQQDRPCFLWFVILMACPFFGSCFVALPFFCCHGRSPNMIYKVLYQKDKIQNPRRETTTTLMPSRRHLRLRRVRL